MNDGMKILLLVAFLLLVGLIQFIPGEAPSRQQAPESGTEAVAPG